jgi:hypothetical protein
MRGILTEVLDRRQARRRPVRGAGPPPGPGWLLRHCLALAATGLLSGCAWWPGDAAPGPRAELIGIRELGRDGGVTRYLITLRLSNPGPKPLRVSGLSCFLRVDGAVVAEGFSGPLAPLAPHSATRISVEAKANLLAGLKLMSGSSPGDSRVYRLDVRLRRPWLLLPLALTDTGEVVIER